MPTKDNPSQNPPIIELQKFYEKLLDAMMVLQKDDWEHLKFCAEDILFDMGYEFDVHGDLVIKDD